MSPSLPSRVKPTKCLSTDPHDDTVTDSLTHYFGCLEFAHRKEFYDHLKDGAQNKINTELRRIVNLRTVISNPKSGDSHAVSLLEDSLKKWRPEPNQQKQRDQASHSEEWHDPHNGALPLEYENYHPDKDFNAYAICFADGKGYSIEGQQCSGEFPHQKILVDNLLQHDDSPLRIKGSEPASPRTVRYFHFPSNNMKVSRFLLLVSYLFHAAH